TDIFFFQAEDGIRDKLVTGVQTCALPIWDRHGGGKLMKKLLYAVASLAIMLAPAQAETKYRFAVVPKAMNNPFFDVARDGCLKRSEERRVGKECGSRGSPSHETAK